MRYFKKIFTLDLRSLAALRTGVASVLIYDQIIKLTDAQGLYSDSGVLPRQALLSLGANPDKWSLHLLSGTPEFEFLLIFIGLIFAFMLLFGYKTRLSTLVSWILTVSIQNRNPLAIAGYDDVMRMLLFWGNFLPWGEYYSVDYALNPFRFKRSLKVFNGATIGYALQVTSILFFSAVNKSGPDWVKDYSAIYYVLHLNQFVTPVGVFLLNNLSWSLAPLTFIVWHIELFAPLLLFIPIYITFFRSLSLLLIFWMFFGFFLTLSISYFPVITSIAFFGFIPEEFWNRVFIRLRDKNFDKVKIYYDSHCSFCQKWVRVFKIFFFLREDQVLPAETSKEILQRMETTNSWIGVDQKNKVYSEFRVVPLLFNISKVLLPIKLILSFPPFVFMGNKTYRLIASSFHNYCEIIPEKKETPEFFYKHFYLEGLLPIIFAILILGWNINFAAKSRIEIVNKLNDVYFTLRLDQYWNMFAPIVYRTAGWYIVSGEEQNGHKIDLWRNGQDISLSEPKLDYRSYKDDRWRKYLLDMWQDDKIDYRSYLTEYFCEKWNLNHPLSKVNRVELIFVDKYFQAYITSKTPKSIILGESKCLITN